MARDNRTLGRFILDGIPNAPRGIPQVEVTFDIDANGILSVKAADKATNKEQNIVIKSSSGLEESDIDRMVDEAKKHEAEDKLKREHIELRNQADTTVYQIEKNLESFKEKLSADEVAKVETAITEVKEALKADETDRIKASMEALTKASHRLAELMYSQAGAAGPEGAGAAPGAAPQDAPKDDGVIDADFEEVK
jgi:molecular chaperone DnaK